MKGFFFSYGMVIFWSCQNIFYFWHLIKIEWTGKNQISRVSFYTDLPRQQKASKVLENSQKRRFCWQFCQDRSTFGSRGKNSQKHLKIAEFYSIQNVNDQANSVFCCLDFQVSKFFGKNQFWKSFFVNSLQVFEENDKSALE